MRLELHWLIHGTILSGWVRSVCLAQIKPIGVGSEIQLSSSKISKTLVNSWTKLLDFGNDKSLSYTINPVVSWLYQALYSWAPFVCPSLVLSYYLVSNCMCCMSYICTYCNSSSKSSNNCSLDHGMNIAFKSKHAIFFHPYHMKFFCGTLSTKVSNHPSWSSQGMGRSYFTNLPNHAKLDHLNCIWPSKAWTWNMYTVTPCRLSTTWIFWSLWEKFLDESELLGHFTNLTGLGISTKLPCTILYTVHLFTRPPLAGEVLTKSPGTSIIIRNSKQFYWSHRLIHKLLSFKIGSNFVHLPNTSQSSAW